MNSSKEDKSTVSGKGVCPKCKAKIGFYGDPGHYHSLPSNKCIICGYYQVIEVMPPAMRVTEVEKSPAFKDCATPGCDTRVSARSEYDHCKKCRGIMRAQQQKEAIERRLEKLGVAA